MNRQEQLEALAEQNRLLRIELSDIVNWHLTEKAPLRKQEINSIERLLDSPDLSTSILAARDARTLRDAAEWFASDVEVISTDLVAKSLRTLAAEKEKA